MRRVTVFGAVLVAIVVAWLCWPAQRVSPAPIEPTAPPTDQVAPRPASPATIVQSTAEPVADATGVRRDVAEPLVVTADSGARLEGLVRPTGIVAEVRRGAGLPPTGPVGRRDQHMQPSVWL